MTDATEKLIIHITMRIEEDLAIFLDEYARREEAQTGTPISRSAVARRILREAESNSSQLNRADSQESEQVNAFRVTHDITGADRALP